MKQWSEVVSGPLGTAVASVNCVSVMGSKHQNLYSTRLLEPSILTGHIMDKYGLKAAAIPSMLLMGIAFSLLSAVKGSWSLAAVALVFGVGNGFCGGILNAFATGLAPKNARTQFLGLWILGAQSWEC